MKQSADDTDIATLNDLNDSRLRIVLFLLFCVYLRPSADHLVNDLGLLYNMNDLNDSS